MVTSSKASTGISNPEISSSQKRTGMADIPYIFTGGWNHLQFEESCYKFPGGVGMAVQTCQHGVYDQCQAKTENYEGIPGER